MDISLLLRTLWTDERGQDLVEYVLLALIVSAAVATALLAVRGELARLFGEGATAIQSQL